jgi:hypothetical protein
MGQFNRNPRLWVLAAVLLTCPLAAHAGNFKVTDMQCPLEGSFYVLHASIDYGFSEHTLEALENGVPLTLNFRARLRRQGGWFWESDLFDNTLRFQLRYHAVAALYQLVNMGGGKSQNFATREAAIAALGEIHSLPIIKSERLQTGEAYELQLQVKLDIAALPLPLRPEAYISPSWGRLSSRWETCHIQL